MWRRCDPRTPRHDCRACGAGKILVLLGMITVRALSPTKSQQQYPPLPDISHIAVAILLLWDDASIRRRRPSMTTAESYIGGIPILPATLLVLFDLDEQEQETIVTKMDSFARNTHTHTTHADVLRHARVPRHLRMNFILVPVASSSDIDTVLHDTTDNSYDGYRFCFAYYECHDGYGSDQYRRRDEYHCSYHEE